MTKLGPLRPPSRVAMTVTAIHRCNACDSVLAAVTSQTPRGVVADVSNPNPGRCFFGTDGKWHAHGCPTVPWPLQKGTLGPTQRIAGLIDPPRSVRRGQKGKPVYTFITSADPTEDIGLQVWDRVNGSQGARFDGTPEGLREALALFRVPLALVEPLVSEMWQAMTLQGIARAPRDPDSIECGHGVEGGTPDNCRMCEAEARR
jgi:hypothetical protein